MNYIFIYCLTYKDSLVQALQMSIHQQWEQTGNPELGVKLRALWDFYPNFQSRMSWIAHSFQMAAPEVAPNSAKAFLAILILLSSQLQVLGN